MSFQLVSRVTQIRNSATTPKQMVVSLRSDHDHSFAVDLIVGPEHAPKWMPGTKVLCTLNPLSDAEARAFE